MPQPGEIKVVNGIHFIFIPQYPESRLREHWATLNGNRVHVYEPYQIDLWSVARYQTTTPVCDAGTEADRMRCSRGEEAFIQAAEWAKNALRTNI